MKPFAVVMIGLLALAAPAGAQAPTPDPLTEIIDRRPMPSPSRVNEKLRAFLQERLLAALKAGDPAEVRYCLERGADIEAPLETPLGTLRPVCFAIDAEDDTVLEVLLERGAKLEGPAARGGSALVRFMQRTDWAKAPGVSRHGFKRLVAAGADLAYVDEEGRNLYELAREIEGFPAAYLTFLEERKPRVAFAAIFDAELAEAKAAAKLRLQEAKRELAVANRDLAYLEAELKRLRALARKGPLHVLDRQLGDGVYGSKDASIKVYNAWKKTIDAFTVQLRCTNNFGRTVYGFGFRPVYKGIYQERIPGDHFATISWSLHGYDTATGFSATITEVHFTDGTTWRPRR